MNININFGNQGYYTGGCWGGCWRPRPPVLRPINSNQGNLDGAVVGHRPNWLFGCRPVRGYGLDLNNNGRYDRGQDGVLAFDFNRDGRLSEKEINESRKRLRAFGGNNDLNGDGKVTATERRKARKLRNKMRCLDLNRDGRLSTHELARAGALVGVDHNRNGHFGRHETYSPYNFPTPGFGRGSLNFVDPARGYNQVNHGWAWSHPPCYGRYY